MYQIRPVPCVQAAYGDYFWSKAGDTTLAQYLQYYNIASELVEQGGTLTLKPNSREKAWKILGEYTHNITR